MVDSFFLRCPILSVLERNAINSSLFGTILPRLIFSLLGRLQVEQQEWGAITLTNRKAMGLLAESINITGVDKVVEALN